MDLIVNIFYPLTKSTPETQFSQGSLVAIVTEIHGVMVRGVTGRRGMSSHVITTTPHIGMKRATASSLQITRQADCFCHSSLCSFANVCIVITENNGEEAAVAFEE